MLTARGEEADVVLGFAQGADDYVVKPCRPREVVARVNALARRVMPSRNEAAEVLTFGRLRIDSARRTVTVDGSALGLTPMEFALLHYLAGNPGRVSPRLELLRSLWKTQVESYARNVDCHVTRLRRKLEESGLRPAPLRTVHGVGYVFEPPGGP